MNKEILVILVVGILLVISLVQAFQLNSLIYEFESIDTTSNAEQVTSSEPTTQSTRTQSSSGSSVMVGGC